MSNPSINPVYLRIIDHPGLSLTAIWLPHCQLWAILTNCGHYFVQYRVIYKSAFSTYDFGKTSFLSFCVLGFYVSVSLGFNF